MFNFIKKKKRTAANQETGHQQPPSSALKNSLLSLEQRLMFDAAAAATASEVATEQVAQEQAEAAVSGETSHNSTGGETGGGEDVVQAITNYMPAEKSVEVAFVDPTVPNYQELLAGMDPTIEVIMLDGGQDGVEQMASALEGRTGIDAIHLISHGSAGQLELGTGALNAESMSGEYADELATIQQSLSEQADILVYGCDFAGGDTGQAAVDLLAEMTGADVQASTDLTGNISLGGDWEFEVSTGTIETSVAISYDTQMNWAGILGTETVKDTFSSESYSNNNGTQSWASSWSETDASGSGASGGDVRVNSGQLRIDTDSVGNAISRGVNLSSATSATLTFNYTNSLSGADRIEARVSNDGGATYTTLTGGIFSHALNAGSGSASLDLSGYASANTRIQFIVTGTGGGDRLYVDNVQVSYQTNSAPTITSNSGGATASMSVAENGSTVTAVAATDADAGQTLSYSIAGGADAAQFTINSSTGQLSFVSAPNYEAPTDNGGNNVYDVTVQVSDGNGGTDTQAIAVTVADANEAPTDLVQSAGTGIDLNTDGGNNSYLHTTNGGAILGGRTAFSIEAQFSSSTAPVSGEHKVLLSYATTGADNEVRVGIAQTSSSTCALTLTINGSRVNLSGYDASRLFDGGQHQLGVTWSATNGGYTFYVDGQQVGSGTGLQTGYTTRSTGTLVVGMDQDSVGGSFQISQVFKGTLQDVRVFNDVRTANEISAYLNQDVPTSESGLVADWTMNNLSGGSTSDVIAGCNLTVGSVSGSGWVASTPSLTWKVAENVSNGTVVGTVTGTDSESGDTKSYSFTDSAGGRFAINSSTGQITVADSSLLNYESATGHSVTVRVMDSGGLTYDETFTINLTNLNEAPTDLSLSANTVAENAATGTVVGSVSGTDVDASETKTYSLTDSAGGRFAINSSTGVITVADDTLLDYESARSHNITVQVADRAGLTYHETFAINLTNVNEFAPTITSQSGGTTGSVSLAENSTGVTTVTATDADAGQTLSYSIAGGADAAQFTINGSTGQLSFLSAPNYETPTDSGGNNVYDVTVQVSDGQGGTDTQAIAVTVANTNEAPTDLSLSANSVAENATTGTVVGTVSGTDPDASDTKTYSLTDTAGGRFAINASTGEVMVADGSLLNYENAASHSLTVQVTDSGGQSYTETFTINLTNVNEGPTDLSLSANSVAENATTGTVVGTVSGTDPDAGDTKTYSLTDTAGGRFAINASTGVITVADGSLLNYEAAASHNLIVQVTDSGGQSYTESFTINLTNVNEGPTGADAVVTLSEDTAHTLTTTNFGFSDVDAGDTLSAVRIDTLPTAGTLTLSGVAVTAGQVVTAVDITAGRLVFSPAADANGAGYASLTFSVQDSHSTYDAAPNTLTFDVMAVNDAPTDLALSTNSVAENATTGTVVGMVTGTDPDAGDTKSYSLTDTAGGRFAINASTGELTVADGSLLNYENAASHSLTVRVTDAGGLTYDETFTINLTNVNEGPTGTDATLTLTEDTSHALTAANFGFSDVDAGDSLSAVRIDNLPTAGSLTLSEVAVTVGQVVSAADITAGRLVFTPTANASGTGYASITFSVRDSNNVYDAAPDTLSIHVTAVNDAPMITPIAPNVTFVEGGLAQVIDATGTIVDVDATNLDGGVLTISISANGTADDRLVVGNWGTGPGQVGVSGSNVTYGGIVIGTVSGGTSGSDPLTVTFNTSATSAAVQEVYRSIQFTNESDNPSTATRTLAIGLTDGDGGTATPQTKLVFVQVTNDAPSDLSLSANTVTENAATGTVVGTVGGTDPDAGDTKTYSLTDTAGGRFAINGATGQLTVADSNLLNYEIAASHTVIVRVTDSGGQSYDETFTINLTNVNEAPTDLTLSANSVAENATTGTVVGTVSGTDPDASDTTTYSLTDTAGGRFAINSASGQVTVADGSLLNYEAATSHTVTVRVTDSGGQSYTETFTINLTNVNEAQAGTESTDALIEDMAHTLATTTFGTHATYGSPKTSSSDPHGANELEESGVPLAHTFQDISTITTATPSTEIVPTAQRTHLSVASEESIGNGVNSKETLQSSTWIEKPGSDVPADQTNVHGSATAEAERTAVLEPDDPIDPIENADTSTTLKQSATMILASVALQNSLGNSTMLRKLIARPAGASKVSPETMPQQFPVDDHASNQTGLEHSRSTAEDADQADL